MVPTVQNTRGRLKSMSLRLVDQYDDLYRKIYFSESPEGLLGFVLKLFLAAGREVN